MQIDENGLKSFKPFDARLARPCLFEYVYFARPDSVVNGKSVYEVRKAMGRQLALEHPADADIVVPVPDSGVPASLGFAEQSGLPFELGIIRNHYVGRTFIQPTQNIRDLGVRKKHSPNRVVLEGKKVILIDDSIVRGTTSVKIVRMVREAGRQGSPPALGLPAHHVPGLLRHRHARPRKQAYGRQPHAGRNAPDAGNATAWASCRSKACTRPWAIIAVTPTARSSPTTISPVTIRRV